MRNGWWVAVLTGIVAGSGFAAEPELRTLARGQNSGVTKASEVVVRTAEEWQKLWAQHGAPQRPSPPLPRVDFGREMVVAVFMGEQRTGGYGIQVTGLRVGDRAITVEVKRSQPPPDAIVTQALTQPFHLVAIKKSDLPVKFVAAPGR